MQPEYRKRRDRLKKIIEGLNIDALLVTSLVNVQYLCGFTGSNGFLLISDIHETLFTDSRYIEQDQEPKDFYVVYVCCVLCFGHFAMGLLARRVASRQWERVKGRLFSSDEAAVISLLSLTTRLGQKVDDWV